MTEVPDAEATPKEESLPELPAPTNVIAALARVAAELPGIGKDNTSEQGYQYRGIESITRHAQQLFGRFGIVFVPRVENREVVPLTINNRPWTEDQLTVVYRVYGPGGVEDFIEVGPLVGLGRDNSDKGANKAMTQVFKYALLQTLCIGDAKDDADAGPAHEADAAAAPPDPHRDARNQLGFRIRALSPEDRDRVRAWCDENGVSRVVMQLDDVELERLTEKVDALVIAAEQDAAAEQPDIEPSHASAQEPLIGPDGESIAAEADSPGDAESGADAAIPAQEPRPSTKAQAVKRAKAAVDEMTDEQVAAMVAAYEHEPIEDSAGCRGQLIGLMVDEWESEEAVPTSAAVTR